MSDEARESSNGPPLQPVPTLVIVHREPEHVLVRFDTSLGLQVYWLSLDAARKIGQDVINAANEKRLVVPDVSPPPDLQSGGKRR